MRLPRSLVYIPVCAALLVAGVVGCADDGEGEKSACATVPTGIAPAGSGPDAYTMVLRVNTSTDVEELVSGPLRSRIRDRDIFLINTEYRTMTPKQAGAILDRLREEFTCNRIAALNGLSPEKKKPGYIFSLAGNPALTAVVLDWEESTWEETGKGAWSEALEVNVVRAREELRRVSEKIAAAPGEPQTRVGLATEYRAGWDYAALGRELVLLNRELDKGFLGYQLVQSQNRCGGTQTTDSIAEVAEEIRSQYGELARGAPDTGRTTGSAGIGQKVLNHLGFEISFSANPKAGSGLAVTRDSPADAASCSRDVLGVGAGALIYWATPAAIEKMLDTPVGKELRPG
ncbi:MAG: hypothetical protein ACKOB2_01855 [Solirubrobacterales bacterium]